MVRFFISIYTYFCSRRRLLFGLLAMLVVGMVISLSRMKYREDIADFLPNSKENVHINAVYRQVGNSGKLMVSFSMRDTTAQVDTELLIEAIDAFALLLDELDSLHTIPEVTAQVDESRLLDVLEFVQKNAPYFLTEADYIRMDTLLSKERIAQQVRESKRLLLLPSGSLMRQSIAADPLHLFTPLLLKLKDLQAGDGGGELTDGHLFSGNGQKGMVILTSPYGASETAGNAALLRMVNKAMLRTEAAFPDVAITCFGAPAIAVTNASQIKKDSALAISLSVALILALLIYFFRSGRSILLIFAPVLFGWLFALACLSIFRESISVIAVGVSSVFVGIAVNYPLHFIDHLKHQPSMRQALKEIIPPLLVGNITTVGAFLSLVFISSDAMRDLGLFGSLLLVGTMLFVLICLPHIVKPCAATGQPRRLPLERLASFAPETKRWILWPALLLTCIFLYFSQLTAFEPDMNKISYMTAQQRKDMRYLQQLTDKKGMEAVCFVAEGRQLDEALAVYEQNAPLLDSLRRTGLIASSAGATTFLASRSAQQARIARWDDFWSTRGEAALQQLEKAGSREGFRPGAFEPFAELLHARFAPQDDEYFTPVTSLSGGGYLLKEDGRSMVISLLYCHKEKTAELMEAVGQASAGTLAFSSSSVGQQMVDSLSSDFSFVLYACGFVVLAFLTLSFGRIELSLLSFLPLAASWVWILGIMQLGDMRFNIVNIILATFIFGQGDDYTIFMTEGLMYEYAYRRKMLTSYKNSIVLSSLVMLAGIGTLIFAKHPAMRSLAEVTIIGMFSVVAMAYIIPPLIFRWLTQRGGRLREMPVTIRRLAVSLYVGAVFVLGCTALTIAGFVLLRFGRKSEQRKARYHSLLHRTAGFVVRHIPSVKFACENLSGETFEKPAIIISNHQSHLDLMCLMMLTPRLIILTNSWVWSNPFYGRLIKYADFYPVTDGVEQGLGQLSELVQKGYSIVVFPEGTRSKDCSILRFHRGAFYLAEALKLDIVPVFLHGVGHVLPKNELTLRSGAITVQVHPRIAPNDARYGADYAARAKLLRQRYRETLEALSQRIETAAYFGSFVRHSYLYKGASIERSVRRALRTTSCYSQWVDACAGAGTALVLNSGNGAFALLLALVHKRMQVVAVDGDADMVALAQGCAGRPSNLNVYEEAELPPNASFDVAYLLNPDEAMRKKYCRYNPQIVEAYG
ncbi:MAG: 1-acyl-sn-glycerol-3-phosphate acyltransferase [Prevotellaceae bacterium]|jgi:1-acyl-sn-glycerol-3-phosphate acyltransferase|nr:1-acyl-sn-glycerol-3-phosphate acyltransferase [Prevotellaceae bacterium]